MDQAEWNHLGVTMSADDVLERFIPYAEKILITGCHGLLGQKLYDLLSPANEIIGVDLSPETHLSGRSFRYLTLDITNRGEVTEAVLETEPNVIINTAALTGVDFCEEERELCWRVNVTGVENLIHSAQKNKAHLIQISSDYVFDGQNPPYRETDVTRPLGFYGKSKLAAENALRGSEATYSIVRTQILYGIAPHSRPNFVDFIRESLEKDGDIGIVDDQVGNPTLADDLARGIARIIQLRRRGIYHVSGSESASRFEFARKITTHLGADAGRIKPIKTESLKQKAPRPPDSTFCLDKIQDELKFQPRGMEDGLTEYIKQLKLRQAAPRGEK